jgi:hypothetical protein
MKKFFIVMGVTFAVLIVLAVIGIATIAVKGSALDKESKAYVDQVTPIILADLRKETLLKYSSDDLKKIAKPEDLEKIFDWFKRLGTFQKYKGSTGQANISMTTQSGKVITGQYVAEADFDTGPAQIKIVTVKKGDQWFVQMFNINSMALAGEQNSQPAGGAYVSPAAGDPSAHP